MHNACPLAQLGEREMSTTAGSTSHSARELDTPKPTEQLQAPRNTPKAPLSLSAPRFFPRIPHAAVTHRWFHCGWYLPARGHLLLLSLDEGLSMLLTHTPLSQSVEKAS